LVVVTSSVVLQDEDKIVRMANVDWLVIHKKSVISLLHLPQNGNERASDRSNRAFIGRIASSGAGA
jgi:hypothetical protein